MKILCCANMPMAMEAFSTLGETVLKDGRTITAEDVRNADILAIRSTTRVDEALLGGSRVQFVGTATIGTDHMDLHYLDSHGIKWCSAAGCNANSVSEFFTAAILELACRHGLKLEGMTLGVVGVGNVGRLVAAKGEALGMKVLLNDPPRQEAAAGATAEGSCIFHPLDTLAEQADILTFHVPMTREGPYPTWHMAGSRLLDSLKRGCILINAARGSVIDSQAFKSAVLSGKVAHSVIDTWEAEPGIREDILDIVDIASPHIAGHSYEGKVMGTVLVYRKACRFLGIEPAWDHEALMPAPVVPEINTDCLGLSHEEALRRIVSSVYDICEDDRNLRAGKGNMAAHFDALRKNYRMRREFRFTGVSAANAEDSLVQKIRNLGFRIR